MRRFVVRVRRAKAVFQEKGFVSLFRLGLTFSTGLFFRKYGTFFLYEHSLKERNEADFMPRIQKFTFHIISTIHQADKLAAEGLDLLSNNTGAREKIDKGAIAFCIFVDSELAHIGWLAMTREAKKGVDPLPYRVDFSNREACTGGTITIPKYRGKGLMAYDYFKRLQFLRERGVRISRNAVETTNIASQIVHAKFGPKIYAKASYFKILWWNFGKERPLM